MVCTTVVMLLCPYLYDRVLAATTCWNLVQWPLCGRPLQYSPITCCNWGLGSVTLLRDMYVCLRGIAAIALAKASAYNYNCSHCTNADAKQRCDPHLCLDQML